MSPLYPPLLLALGAAGLLLGLLPRFRFTGLVAIVAAAASLAAHVALLPQLPAWVVLSAWGPASLLPLPLVVNMDLVAWLYGAAILLVVLSTLLTSVARPGGRRILPRGAILLLGMAGLLAVGQGNLITRIMSWAGLDLIYFLVLLFLARSEGLELQSVLNLGFNSVGTLLALGAALLISRQSPQLSLRDAVLSPQATLLITAAAVFRLGLFPLHLALPAEANIRQGLGTVLRLVPTVAALEMMTRLAGMGIADAARPWLALFAALAALVGAAQLWYLDDPRLGLTYLVISQSGVAVAAGLWGGAAAITAQSLALVLGGALIYLSSGHDERRPRRTWLNVFAAAAVAGLPLTVGFSAWAAMAPRMLSVWGGLALASLMAAQMLLLAGLLRASYFPGTPVEGEPLVHVTYQTGLGLLGLGLVGGAWLVTAGWPGLEAPPLGLLGLGRLESLAVAGLVALTLAGGYGLWRFDAARERAEGVGGVVAAALRPDWLYRAAWWVLRSLSQLVRGAADILEGEGAVLWTLVAALLIWLALR